MPRAHEIYRSTLTARHGVVAGLHASGCVVFQLLPLDVTSKNSGLRTSIASCQEEGIRNETRALLLCRNGNRAAIQPEIETTSELAHRSLGRGGADLGCHR